MSSTPATEVDPKTVDVDAKVKKSLEGTPYECSDLQRLQGGSVNWTYVTRLIKPLDDGTTAVFIKHGEKWMLTKPEFALTLIRCRIELECFKCLAGSPFSGKADPSSPYHVTVRTPRYYHFDEEATNQILEFLPGGTTLKDWILKYYGTRAGVAEGRPQAEQLGRSLGSWLRGFAEWSAGRPDLRRTAAENVEAKFVRQMVTFSWLTERVKEYPDVLAGDEAMFKEVQKAIAEEVANESKLEIVHGDFWTGNVLLPDATINASDNVPVFVIDWEMAHLASPCVDFGQMIAELYTIWLYKNVEASLWMMDAFAEAYGEITEEFAFRTTLQVGAHLVCVITDGGRWGCREQMEVNVGVGRDIIAHAWKKDRKWFEESLLAPLFRQVK